MEKYLAECLDSVVGQTYPNTEIIIVDDGSTDGSVGIAQKYVGANNYLPLQKHKTNRNLEIKIIKQKNAGVSVARNTGLAAAAGEWIHFTDPDDKLASPDFYEKVMDAIVTNDQRPTTNDQRPTTNDQRPTTNDTDLAAVGVLDEKYGARPTFGYRRARAYARPQAKINATHVARRPAVWNYIFRREMLTARNLQFEPGRTISQDVMFSIPAVYYARAIVTVPGAYYWYRRNPNGAIRDPARKNARRLDKEIVWTRAAEFAARHGFWFGPRRAFWKWIRARFGRCPGK